MGNTSCSCAQKRCLSEPDIFFNSNHKDENMNYQKYANSCNKNDFNLTMEDNIFIEVENKEDEIFVDTPPIIRTYRNPNQTSNVQSLICSRSHLASYQNDTIRNTSFFSTEDVNDENNFLNQIHFETYEIILKSFLINNYPINTDVIKEMIKRNLLLPQDAFILDSFDTSDKKVLSFLNNFVFSEMNICKLATFLHVLISEKSPLLSNFNKDEFHFRKIVDTIYYVVNLFNLYAECSEENNKPANLKSLTSVININYLQNSSIIKRKLFDSPNEFYFIRIYMNNVIFPGQFWKDFACINEHFHCCQELLLSSCNLNPEDIFNLMNGFVNAGILRNLDLSSNPIKDEGLKHVESLFVDKNSLVTLNISCCSITSIGMEAFLETLFINCEKGDLKNLNISHNDFNDMIEKDVLILTHLPLISLEMKSINLQHQKALYQSLKLNFTLKKVDFSGNKLQNNDLSYLAAGLAYNMRLKRLSLSMTGILKSDCYTINNTLLMNKTIVSIDFSDNLIGDEGVGFLKDIMTMKKTLKEVYLRRCGISHRGILTLLRNVLDDECDVKVLDLCYNHSPRMSFIMEDNEVLRKIEDLLRNISLVKDIKILLWGTIDEQYLKSIRMI